MRARFVLPGIALAAFAATMAVIGRPDQGFGQGRTAGLPLRVVRPVVPARAATPTPSLGFPTVNGPEPDAPVPPPDPAALPSYESDQAARNANPLRSARTR
ncbi:MAG TPA: hypothetical protein VK727_02935 [Steroidobacteraceae bacterium]|nr:hypothetical protein [Steroidobacteraceae bacterium]